MNTAENPILYLTFHLNCQLIKEDPFSICIIDLDRWTRFCSTMEPCTCTGEQILKYGNFFENWVRLDFLKWLCPNFFYLYITILKCYTNIKGVFHKLLSLKSFLQSYYYSSKSICKIMFCNSKF